MSRPYFYCRQITTDNIGHSMVDDDMFHQAEEYGTVRKRQRTAAMKESTMPELGSSIVRMIAQGAEGIVTELSYLGRRAVRKERVPKRYRHPELDIKLRTRRLAQEARILLRLRKAGVTVPAVYDVDARRGVLIMEYVTGTSLKCFLQEGAVHDTLPVMRAAGREVARMHLADVVHGDLTTGNVMVDVDTEKQYQSIHLIDFGLSYGNSTEEDLAVDLYVFERAVVSSHSEEADSLNEAFLSAYSDVLQRPAVLSRLVEVRARGRKRDMTG